MLQRTRTDISLLVIVTALTRYLFRSRFLYDIDSVNFGLAIRHFDPEVHQPHPPGYFLYVCMGRLLNLLCHNANLSLVLLSIFASCAAVVVIYRMAFDWFGTAAARFAGALFLFSPLAWFHGTVALTYIVEAFFSALVGYLCWRVMQGTERYSLLAALALGISAGVRPSSLLFLGPLFLFSLWKVPARTRLSSITVLLFTLAAWFVPMIVLSGGMGPYFDALFSLWRMVPARNTVFNSSPATSIARACTIVFIYFLGFGAATVAVFMAGRAPSEPRKRIFTAVWMLPALVFFTFIFFQFVNSGYLLILAAPACIWLGYWASLWYQRSAWSASARWALLSACAIANVSIFLFSPFYCSYRSVCIFQAQLNAIRAALPRVGSPSDTVIVGFDSHFLGYRHAGYYFPGYLTVEYPQVKLIQGIRVFAMNHGDTRLLPRLPLGAQSRFVLFPLPNDSSAYPAYLHMVEAKLPHPSLRTIRAGGFDFVTGPISDLPLLFPGAAPASPGVYVPSHSVDSPVNRRAHRP